VSCCTVVGVCGTESKHRSSKKKFSGTNSVAGPGILDSLSTWTRTTVSTLALSFWSKFNDSVAKLMEDDAKNHAEFLRHHLSTTAIKDCGGTTPTVAAIKLLTPRLPSTPRSLAVNPVLIPLQSTLGSSSVLLNKTDDAAVVMVRTPDVLPELGTADTYLDALVSKAIAQVDAVNIGANTAAGATNFEYGASDGHSSYGDSRETNDFLSDSAILSDNPPDGVPARTTTEPPNVSAAEQCGTCAGDTGTTSGETVSVSVECVERAGHDDKVSGGADQQCTSADSHVLVIRSASPVSFLLPSTDSAVDSVFVEDTTERTLMEETDCHGETETSGSKAGTPGTKKSKKKSKRDKKK
jgi:hypothetical protein